MNKEIEHIFYTSITHIGFDMKEMLQYIENKEVSLEYVMSLALSQQQPQARLSCWIITHFLHKNPNGIRTFIDSAIDFLPYTTHTGQTREIIHWFTICKPNDSNNLGKLLDYCLQVLQNPNLPVAIHVHAMTVIEDIAKQEKEILPEFITIIADLLPYTTVGGANKIKKLLVKYQDTIEFETIQ